MSLPIFYFKDLSLSFGKTPLFSQLTGQITPKEKICIIGKNGSGKSSLLKIMAGLIEADSGRLDYKSGTKISYLAQHPLSDKDISIYQYVLDGITDIDETEKDKKGYLASIILAKLDLNPEETLAKLSGGKLRRANLARALVVEPDLLFLDEPTNHLDISSIEWLEEYLKNFTGGLFLVSHDKAFLRNVSNRTMWLDRGKLLYNKHGFSDFDRWSEEVYEKENRELINLGKELDKENLWLQQGVTARRKRNQQRLHNLFELRQKIKGDKTRFNNISNSIKLDSISSNNQAKMIVEMNNVNFKFPDTADNSFVLKNFSLNISKKEVIGVVGKNGAGKSTLIKLITGDLSASSGSVKLGANLKFSYLDQSRSQIDPDKTLWETLCPGGGDTIYVAGKAKHVVAYLKDFLFDTKQAHSKVSTLSGGEQNRLLLAILFANPGNFLILDEPTNDLDIDSLDMLVEILSEYDGTILIVSHDRDFLERLVSRTIIIEQGSLHDYHGGYYQYSTALKNDNIKTSLVTENKNKVIKKIATKLSYKDERELALLPDRIEQLSNDLKKLEAEMSDPELYLKNPKYFTELSDNIDKKKEELSIAENKWLELEEMKTQLYSS